MTAGRLDLLRLPEQPGYDQLYPQRDPYPFPLASQVRVQIVPRF
jgi:hypothetical protein